MSEVEELTLLKQCRHGRMLFLRRDRYVGASLELYGEFSELEARLFEQVVKPGDAVVEVGANIGAHTVHLARLVGPRGAVVAFEPQRVIFQLLCANLALNEILHVHAYCAAAGRAPGVMKVPPVNYTAIGNFGGLALRGEGGGEDVPVLPLDRLNLASVRLLKIDVEGMEGEVLAGARALVARHRPILYVENDRRERSAALIGLIADMGYRMWWHLPPLFNPENFAGNPNNVFARTVSINMLCLPNENATVVQGLRAVTGVNDWWQ